ncbi:MAG: DnaB-like helicase C-terminal domain-containing protein [Bacilli bacterium]|nr:DnaB-like helicase C-terminal domain-containing protein [Bacilli bacterium]
MAYRTASRSNVPVAIFELEMKETRLAKRMLSMVGTVDGFRNLSNYEHTFINICYKI